MAETDGDRTVPIILWMGLFVVVGAPFVYLIWEFVNHVLSGDFRAGEAALALLGVVGLAIVLRFVARRAAAWEDSGP